MSTKQERLDQIEEFKNASIEDVIHDLKVLHAESTPGWWVKGNTTHDSVAVREGEIKPYAIGSFRHACDAAFIDAAHAWVPRLIEEIERLRTEKK